MSRGAMPEDGFLGMSSREWQNICEIVKSDPEIARLRLADMNHNPKNGSSMAVFVSPGGEACAIFRGTGFGEWPDNILGASSVQTAQQKEALEWFNSLPYENITVAGHSKGGNKAMYVAVMSDKAGECYSFDGQGFSPDFIEDADISRRIDAKRNSIHSISNYRDFVSVMLLPIAGDTRYIQNDAAIDSLGKYHSPYAILRQYWNTDINDWEPFDRGSAHMALTPLVYPPPASYGFGAEDARSPSLELLHGFNKYLLTEVPKKERDLLVGDLAEITGYLTNGGVNIDLEDVVSYVMSAKLLLDSMKQYVAELKAGDPVFLKLALMDAYRITARTAGKSNADMSAHLFSLLNNGAGVSLASSDDYASYEDITRDFTDETKATLLSLVREVEDESFWSVDKWDIWYRVEQLFGHLSIDNYTDDAEKYYRKVVDVNNASVEQIEKIFQAVHDVDNLHANELSYYYSGFSSISKEFNTFAQSITPMSMQ
jgi:hypothetical protein